MLENQNKMIKTLKNMVRKGATGLAAIVLAASIARADLADDYEKMAKEYDKMAQQEKDAAGGAAFWGAHGAMVGGSGSAWGAGQSAASAHNDKEKSYREKAAEFRAKAEEFRRNQNQQTRQESSSENSVYNKYEDLAFRKSVVHNFTDEKLGSFTMTACRWVQDYNKDGKISIWDNREIVDPDKTWSEGTILLYVGFGRKLHGGEAALILRNSENKVRCFYAKTNDFTGLVVAYDIKNMDNGWHTMHIYTADKEGDKYKSREVARINFEIKK